MTADIVIADDDPDLREILKIVLETQGYVVRDYPNGSEALESIRKQPPDLVILDYMMPEMTGPQVCGTIKEDTLLRHIPVLLLTGKSETHDKVTGINAGADDYLIKPFEPQELLARVQMILKRTLRELEANPLTRLPGNTSIQTELENRLSMPDPSLAVCYVDLDHFKEFNDYYGFQRGDQAIRETARVLLDVVQDTDTQYSFVGHIGGDDFIVICNPEAAETLCRKLIESFDAMAVNLYDEEDKERGYIVSKDRMGNRTETPILTVSIALVTSQEQPLEHPGQIAQIGAELKSYAKTFKESKYVLNRRSR